MSSLHQDRLLVEGPEIATAARTPLAPARGRSRRPTEEKVMTQVPTQRQGKAQRLGSTTTDADGSVTAPRPKRSTSSKAAAAASGAAGTLAARAKAAKSATTRAASARAVTARAATVKVATAKAATAKAATTKAATAARTAAVAKVAARTASKSAAATKTAAQATPAAKPVTAAKATPAAKPATAAKATPAANPVAAEATAVAKPAADKPAAAQATPAAKPDVAKPEAAKAAPVRATPAAKPAPAAEPAAVRAAGTGAHRATPYKRTPVEQPPVVVVDSAESASAATTVVPAAEVVASLADGVRSPFLRRRPPTVRRRPALYLAAALVGALGVSCFSTSGPTAQATDTMSQSVSVAHELGIDASPTDAAIDPASTQRLEELAVSRNTRDAEQTAAAAVQAEADQAAAQAAAEAARPKVVLPVSGARLTIGFGARWGTLHAGIDLAAPIGTPEYAAMDGVVLEAGPASGFGLAVYIQHENGDVTVYGHMEQILVQAGQVVKAGDTIALLGNRGQSTGPHLHFEVHVGGINGQKIDPLPWLRERGVAI
jgi:hypothetical protein